ncbi:MAG: hypothetical protein JSW46_07535 [Gemmatimonadota bacterium]|nr:MAG: hypothetical protein JSW46_07535 [Gemmatimonadota bacterium]
MRNHDPERRQFVKLVASLPVAFAFGCDTERYRSAADAPPLSPEESLRKLVLMLGPWRAGDTGAEDFAARFVASSYAGGQYLPGSAEMVQSLARRFPDGEMAVSEVDLGQLPADERQLLLNLVSHIYSLIEVRFFVANEPPWGACQGDRTRHTRAPA